MKTILSCLACMLLTMPIAVDAREKLDEPNTNASQVSEKLTTKGVIEEVKLLSVKIKPDDGKIVSLSVNEKTVIKRRGQRISVKDLKVGEIVRATFVLAEDRKIALKISVVSK